MKLGFRDITPFIASPRKAMGVLVYGPDLGLVRHRVNEIVGKILTNPDDPFGRVEISAEQLAADPAKLHDELSAFSFTGEARLVMLRDATDGLTETISEALAALCDKTYLIVFAGDLPSKSSLRLMAEKHPHIAALPCYKEEGAGLDALIRETFTGYGLRVNTEVIRYLSASLGGDRMVVLNEIEKISLYAGDEAETVSLDEVIDLVGDNSDRGQDELNAAVASGNIELAMRLLDKMALEGVNAVPIVRGLMRYLTRLQEIHLLIKERGGSIESVVDGLRPPVFFKLKPVLTQHARRWTLGSLSRALERLFALEIEVKRYHDQNEARLGQAVIGLSRLGR